MTFTATIDNVTVEFSGALIRKYDRPGPRYTSYPTAPTWSNDFTPANYRAAVESSNAPARLRSSGGSLRPLSLYFHLPFCEEHCTFCGCNVVITKQKEISEPYLANLEREINLVGGWLDSGREAVQLHWGGGTPTYLSCEQSRRVYAAIRAKFRFAADAEIGVEVDPRVTTAEQIATLRECGFNRISMGIQDFDPEVQKAINRIQPVEMTAGLIDTCRKAGFESINVDLIYGLPYQRPETSTRTMETVTGLNPDRVALYNFAFVPWLKVHQRHIDPATLPSPETKLQIYLNAIGTFTSAGYRFIGMDHFARPNDELAKALDARTLWRNFQGYTTKVGTDLVAFGITSISDVDGNYAQNVKTMPTYGKMLAQGIAPIERGMVLSEDDKERRHIIRELLCNNFVELDLDGRFKDERAALKPIEDDGLVKLTPRTIHVNPLGRLFVRNIAMVFDKYLAAGTDKHPIYSRTV